MQANILLSIKSQYLKKIISGDKTAEIRRIFPLNSVGKIVYVYVPVPERYIIGFFKVTEVFYLPPTKLWNISGPASTLSKNDFFSYLSGKEFGIAIHFLKFTKFYNPISLDDIRHQFPKFHPPQSFQYTTVEMEKILQ